MKRKTKKRRQKQLEFKKKYSNLFSEYRNQKGNGTTDIVKKIASLARREIDYSPKTIDYDIVISLSKLKEVQ